MSFLGRLLGYVSVAVNLALSLALLFFGLIASFAATDMRLPLVPDWAGSVTSTVLLGGLVGLIAVVLALRCSKLSRTALVLWSLLVTAILASAFWSSTYRFDGLDDVKSSAWTLLGSVAVLIGSWLHRKGAVPKRR
jgi:hypothetical protein